MDFNRDFFKGREMFFSRRSSDGMPSMEDLIEGHKNFDKSHFSGFGGFGLFNRNAEEMGNAEDLNKEEFNEIYEKRVKAFRDLGFDI